MSYLVFFELGIRSGVFANIYYSLRIFSTQKCWRPLLSTDCPHRLSCKNKTRPKNGIAVDVVIRRSVHGVDANGGQTADRRVGWVIGNYTNRRARTRPLNAGFRQPVIIYYFFFCRSSDTSRGRGTRATAVPGKTGLFNYHAAVCRARPTLSPPEKPWRSPADARNRMTSALARAAVQHDRTRGARHLRDVKSVVRARCVVFK